MASSSNGFSSMTLLGTTNFAGVFEGPNRDYLMLGNHNPSNMLTHVRQWLGNDVVFIIERNFNRNVVVYKMRRMSNGHVNPTTPLDVFWLLVNDNATFGDFVSDDDDDGSSSDPNEGNYDHNNSNSDDDGSATPPPNTISHKNASAFRNITMQVQHIPRTEELSQLEQTLAYGVTSSVFARGQFAVTIRALKGQTVYISENTDHTWSASILWNVSPSINPERFTMERIMACTVNRGLGLWPTVVQLHVHTKNFQNRELILHFKI